MRSFETRSLPFIFLWNKLGSRPDISLVEKLTCPPNRRQVRHQLASGLWTACLWIVIVQAAQAQWTLQGNAIAGEASGDQAGTWVSFSADGQTVAVGAIGNSGFKGQVKVYKLMNGLWGLQGNAIAGDAAGDWAGHSVALSSDGQTVAIGAPRNSAKTGQVKVYKLVNGVWTRQGNAIAGMATGDQAGSTVSLSSDGQVVALDAPGNSSANGQIRVYKLVSGIWTRYGSALSGDQGGGYSVASVSLSSDGQTVAVGAPGTNENKGQVKVFKLINSTWTLQSFPLTGEASGDQAGYSVALSSGGQTVAIGAPGNSQSKGQVKVYKLESGVWYLQGNVIAGDHIGDNAGNSVSLAPDGQTVAVGAIDNNGLTGQVKVYNLVNGVWAIQGSAITGDASSDFAGTSVALSSDGQTVGVGAPGNSQNKGQVKVYHLCTLTIGITPSSQPVCARSTVTLSASGGASYVWSSGQSTPVISVSPTTTTTYSVTGTSGICTATATATIAVNPLAGITAQPVASSAICPGATVTASVSTSGLVGSYQWYKAGALVNGQTSATLTLQNVTSTTAGSYAVVVTGACNSVTSTAFNLTVSELPIPTLTPGPSATLTCAVTSLTLVSSGGASYAFAGPGIVSQSGPQALINAAGTYSVTVTSGTTGCIAASSVVIVSNMGTPPLITNQPPSSATVITNAAISVSLSATGTMLTYQWYKDGVVSGTKLVGATTNTLNLTDVTTVQSGTYSCVIVGECGSVNSQGFVLTVTAPLILATEPLVSPFQIAVYPNPATSSSIWVKIQGATQREVHLQLMNILGQVVWERSLKLITPEHTEPIELSNLSAGLLWLRASTSEQHQSVKLLKR